MGAIVLVVSGVLPRQVVLALSELPIELVREALRMFLRRNRGSVAVGVVGHLFEATYFYH